MFKVFLSLILLVPTISFANNFYLKGGVGLNSIKTSKFSNHDFEDINSSFKIESKVEPSIKQGFVTKILDKGNTLESIYPSNNESKILESIVLSGDNELEEI